MRRICGSGCEYFRQGFLSFAGVAILCAPSCLARGILQVRPRHRNQNEGVVEELKFSSEGDRKKEAAHLADEERRNGHDWTSYLCPKAFMDDMGITFIKGR